MKETADQAHAIFGLIFCVSVERLHGPAWQFMGGTTLFGAGQAIVQVAQQEQRVPGIQALGLLLALDMQPAVALHDQVEAGPGQAVGAGVPAAAVTADMEQAGVEFEAF